MDGVSFAVAWGGRKTVHIVSGNTDIPASYIGLEALIKNKRAAARPKDFEDLHYLQSAFVKKRNIRGK